MKKLLLMAYLFLQFVEANEMCINFKPEITIRDKEDVYTQENALKALKFLESYVKDEKDFRKTEYGWAIARIQGYILRDNALKVGSDPESLEYHWFCTYITRQGVHREH